MRSRSQLLGVVYAPDEKSAEAAAIAEFKIGEDMRLQPRLKDITAQGWRYSIFGPARGAMQSRCHRPPAAPAL
jgi:hypothetical protein